MGDPDATPSSEVVGAELVSGTFEVLDPRPSGYDERAVAVHPLDLIDDKIACADC